eukprot:1593536-Pleurochrysis_carterae.AAC.7
MASALLVFCRAVAVGVILLTFFWQFSKYWKRGRGLEGAGIGGEPSLDDLRRLDPALLRRMAHANGPESARMDALRIASMGRRGMDSIGEEDDFGNRITEYAE